MWGDIVKGDDKPAGTGQEVENGGVSDDENERHGR